MKYHRPGVVASFLCFLVILPLGAQADPNLQVVEWSEKLRPAVFSADTAMTSWASYPLKGVEGSRRPELEARWHADFPAVDGDLTDWPLVRWHAVRSHGSVVRGNWTGAADASMRFAVLWNEQGMFIGIEATDDVLVVGTTDEEPQDSFLLSFGSQSASVQRWWRGADRTLRLAANGQLRSTAFLRNRHRVAFDAQVLGTRTAIRRDGVAGGKATLRAEIFVPWRVLFPLLPHSALRPMINISYEDVEDDASTLLAAATRVDSSEVNPSWSRLEFGGKPPQGTWVLSAGSGHLEIDAPLEWAVLKLDATSPWELEVEAAANVTARLRTQCPVGPAIVRVNGLPRRRSTWQPSRIINLQLHVGDSSRAMQFLVTPDAGILSAGISELDSLEKVHAEDVGFPGVPDVYVRLKDVSQVAISELGNSVERRYHGSGILVWRASLWQILERRILRAQLLRDQIVDAPGTATRWNAMFPQRTALGVPVGVVLMRGYRSDIDGSIQPYALYVSRAVTRGRPTPLVLALHSVKKDEQSLFSATSLAQQTEKHGWIAVSPYGRGDSGFTLAGETDVLDVLHQVIRDLPVDRARIFATGAGMGGTGVWLLSLRHSNLFAAAAVVSGYGDMDRQNYFQLLGYHPLELFHFETMNPIRLVRPGLQTRYRIIHGRGDPVIADAHARAMHGALQEQGVSSELILDEQARHGEPLLQQHLAEIFTFFAEQAPGTSGEASDRWFGGVGGPLATVYPRGAFAIVYGSHDLPKDTPAVGDQRRAGRSVTGPQADQRTAFQFAAEWESIFEGRPRVLADTMVTASMQSEQNLVLVGDPRTNVVLQSIAAELPVQWSGDEFTIAGTTYSFEEYGVVFAAPHPHQAGRTVVVVSGMAERLGNFEKSLLKLGTDYIVTDDRHQFVDLGQFEHFVMPRTPRRTRQ